MCKHGHQLRKVDGLDEVVVESRRARQRAVLRLAVAGQGDEHGTAAFRGGAQASGQRIAIHIGQPDVEDKGVERFARRSVQSPVRVMGDQHRVSVGREQVGQQARSIFVVVNQQQPQRLAFDGRRIVRRSSELHARRFCHGKREREGAARASARAIGRDCAAMQNSNTLD